MTMIGKLTRGSLCFLSLITVQSLLLVCLTTRAAFAQSATGAESDATYVEAVDEKEFRRQQAALEKELADLVDWMTERMAGSSPQEMERALVRSEVLRSRLESMSTQADRFEQRRKAWEERRVLARGSAPPIIQAISTATAAPERSTSKKIEKKYLAFAYIYEPIAGSICSKARKVVEKNIVSAQPRSDLYRQLRNAVEQEFKDAAEVSVALASQNEFLLAYRGTRRVVGWNCSSDVMGVAVGKTYAEAISAFEHGTKDWQSSAVFLKWPSLQ